MASTLDVLNAARLAFYDNKPSATICQNASQSVPNNADTALTFDTVVNDNWNGWSSGTPTRYTAQVPGLYLLSGASTWNGNATGRRYSFFRLNGTTQVTGTGGDLASTLTNTMIVPCTTAAWFLNAGDYIELIVNQTSGAALGTNGGTGAFSCSMTLVFLHT